MTLYVWVGFCVVLIIVGAYIAHHTFESPRHRMWWGLATFLVAIGVSGIVSLIPILVLDSL